LLVSAYNVTAPEVGSLWHVAAVVVVKADADLAMKTSARNTAPERLRAMLLKIIIF